MGPGIDTKKLITITEIFIASSDFLKRHGLTQTLSKEQFSCLPLILYQDDDPASNLYKEANTGQHIVKSDSSSMVFLLVKNSIGIGRLNHAQLKSMNDPNVVEVRVEGFTAPTFTISVAYNKNLSRPARAFLDGLLKFRN